MGLNTNMHLESLHKVLKHIYMQGKRVQRVDRVVSALTKMTRDKIYSRMISLARGRTVSRSRRGFFQRHMRGAELASDVQMEQGVYLVPAADGEELTIKQGAPCTQCRESCAMCGVCPHSFICECEDSRRNMCEHVHAVAVFREGKKQKVKPEISVTELETYMGNMCGESGPAAETPDPLEAAK